VRRIVAAASEWRVHWADLLEPGVAISMNALAVALGPDSRRISGPK
jgi:hypothetical protein